VKNGALAWILVSLIFLTFAGCASFQVKKQGSFNYRDMPFETVWNAAIRSLDEMGFEIKDSKKEKIGLPAYSEWTGYIFAVGKRNVFTQVAAPQMRVNIKRQGGKVEVSCEAVQPKQFVDYGGSKKNIEKFHSLLNKNLQN
jgi:hypothetical protein